MNESIFKHGEFFIGCNYWASHAGTNMWHDWRPEVIENDFKLLSSKNVKYLRIFPLWPDFQPIKMHRGGGGCDKEIRMGEDPLPFTEAGRAGVSELMCERFQYFCDLAEKYGMKLVVGLLTGWMSGRLYVPDLFEKVNVLSNPRAIKWEIRFVKYMVRRFKDHPAIAAWDLGNECNCMGGVDGADGAYLWVSAITDAIKTEDTSRPVISGMHGTFPEKQFRPEDLGEILDVLCTHPYPLFTPHCMTDAVMENKSTLHAVAETVLYRGLSGKPAFAEEVGTLGPMIASEENAAAYVNTIIHQLWAHDCMGFMWWCGFEQSHLTHTPYAWDAVERELGLFHADYSPKPVVEAMSDFVEFTKSFGRKLPSRIVDAVCILTADNDTWLAAFGSFILAKQAGLDIEFCYVGDEIPEARAYIMPSFGHTHLARSVSYELMERVKKGAALYVSIGNALMSPFKELFGIEPQCHYQPTKGDLVTVGGHEFQLWPSFKMPYKSVGAETIANDDAGTPVFVQNKLGEGTVYFLTYPIEDMAGNNAGINSGERMVPLYKFYEAMPLLRNPEKKVAKDNPHVAVTEHIDGDKRIVVAINCVPRESAVTLKADGMKLSEIIKNQGAEITAADGEVKLVMQGNSAVVLELA